MSEAPLKVIISDKEEIKRSETLDIFIPFVKGLSHSFVIALNSPWGTGKTTFVNQCISELGEDYPSIYYNAWKADYSKDPFIDFCAEIIDLEDSDSTTSSDEKQNLLSHAKRIGKNIWDKKADISLSLISKIGTKERPLRIPFSRPCLALRTQFDVLTAPQLGLIPGLFLPFLAEMPDFGRTSPFRLAPVEQLFSN
ncbi:protein of unknown function [Pseudodesulfovibrio profundus]|uniref:KAP NTPase domain-containing protein n=1 Tax=Pseudodesulfovibrio profundus TaxID=57320 RepID=A0A2C8F8E5_9BACT|nr:P-loop NTPase fold protein [Pseudodesulfovibrio profundus]SOB58781.1 protein of unknown function [Pseudodesulfovibrio profundus]